MANLLLIETATQVCSVAFASGNQIIGLRESAEEKAHASMLTVFINQMVVENKIAVSDIDAVAVSKGPGSYTGLRIGVSVAKGICYALDKPLIAISTLQAMAGQACKTGESYLAREVLQNAWFCPMIDARRMEVYTALYNFQNEEIRETRAEIIDENSYQDILEKRKMVFFGNGSEKCRQKIHHPNAVFIDEIVAGASLMNGLAQKAFEKRKFENTAYFEPFYLKDFIATVSKKNIFGN